MKLKYCISVFHYMRPNKMSMPNVTIWFSLSKLFPTHLLGKTSMFRKLTQKLQFFYPFSQHPTGGLLLL